VLTCLSSGALCANALTPIRHETNIENAANLKAHKRLVESMGGLLFDWIEYHPGSQAQHRRPENGGLTRP
jgi:hypothetical protein